MELAILEPYLLRIEKRSRLTTSMKAQLQSYPVMVTMIRAAVSTLSQLEEPVGMKGTVRLTRLQLYRHVLATCDALIDLVPVTSPFTTVDDDVPDHVTFLGEIRFERRPKYPFHVFNGAMTIARHVGLIAGWGRSGLNPDLVKRLRRRALVA
jgi:hypothetical protein